MDRPGEILTDFQTVQGTNDIFLNAEGKKRTGGSTIITPKQYLQDARFTIYLEGENEILEKCFSAIRAPFWTPYLGRKNCVPSVPVLPEWIEAKTLEEAVCLFSKKDKKYCGRNVMVEMDLSADSNPEENERVYIRNDSVFRADRNEYQSRHVKSFVIATGGDPA